MPTTIRFERNAMMSAAHLSAEDGGTSFVFCSIPGGTPQFQTNPRSQYASAVVGAPACNTHREFVAFVNERFGDDPTTERTD